MKTYNLLAIVILSVFAVEFSFAQSDDPCGAPSLTVGASCSFSTYTNATATASAGVPAPGCAFYSGGDVWFTITVPASGNVAVDQNTGVITDAGMAIYSGTCASLTLIECDDDDSPNGAMSFIQLTGQTPGATLWVRVWEYGNNNNGTFDICAYEPVVATPPTNDDPCAATPLTVGASCSFSTYTNAAATASAGVPAPGCASYSGGDVWFSITVPASGDVTIDQNTGVITDAGMAIYSGTCAALTLIECDDDDSPNGAMSMIALTGQTPGATLWVRVWEYGNNNNGTFDICAYEPVPVVGPVNDDPCAATALTVGASCTFATYTNAGASGSAGVPAPGCASYSGGDVWFTVTVPASGNVSVDQNTGVITDAGMAIYSGTCASLTLIECDDDDSPNGAMSFIQLTGQTPGATLWVRVWEYGNNNNGTFDICAYDPVIAPPPANDDCSGAYPLTVNATSCIVTTAGTVNGGTASVQNTASCFGTENDDVWFSFVAPASGAVDASILNIAGSTLDMYHSVWEGVCPALTLVAGTCSDPNTSTITSLTPGDTYYLRVNSYTATSGQTSTFDVCLVEATPCGGQNTNDWCQAPAILTQGPGSWSSSTSSTYTVDLPANINSIFCGSIENNSWYQFTALSATETFDITNVFNCTSNFGIQAQVYEVTTDVNGCCTNFTSFSNCYNPGTTTLGTVSATGLTIGNTYMLMIDGNAGDDCEFTISNWTATGILPVELVNFHAIASTNQNILTWQTVSEFNNDFFRVMRSFDGVNFEAIGIEDGNGNTNTTLNYQFNDNDVRNGDVYYRLEQVDFDGTTDVSEVVKVSRKPMKEGLLAIYPNPSSDMITVELYDDGIADATVDIVSMSGQVIYSSSVSVNGLVKKHINISEFPQGVYNVVVRQSNEQEMKRLIVE